MDEVNRVVAKLTKYQVSPQHSKSMIPPVTTAEHLDDASTLYGLQIITDVEVLLPLYPRYDIRMLSSSVRKCYHYQKLLVAHFMSYHFS